MGKNMSVKFEFNYDNQAESKTGSAVFNGLESQPCDGPFNVLMGYDLKNCMTFSINSPGDLKTAVYDAVSVLNSSILAKLKSQLSKTGLTPDEQKFRDSEIATGKKFYEINWSNETRLRMSEYGRIQKAIRDINKKEFHILLFRGKNDRNYIRTANHSKTAGWHWQGWSEPTKINFVELYRCIAETESQCRMLDGFISGVCE